jgi:hypothetical protein
MDIRSTFFGFIDAMKSHEIPIGLMTPEANRLISLDWFKGKKPEPPHISWDNPWFPVDFPLSQSIEIRN